MKDLSLVMIVRNEEKKLGRCLKSVAGLVQEIIIVDTGSSDRTKEIATAFEAKVFDFVWTNDFSEARNYALSKSTSKWNLILDADNYVTHIDMEELKEFLTSSKKIGKIKIIDEVIQNEQLVESEGWYSRLLPAEVNYTGRIHEQVNSDYDRINVPIVVRHDGYLETDKSNRNMPLLIQALEEQPTHPYYNYQLGREYYGIKEFKAACNCFEKSYANITGFEAYAPNVIVQYIYALIGQKNLSRAMEIINQSHEFVGQFSDYHFVCGIFYLEYIMDNPSDRVHLLYKIEESYLKAIEVGESDLYETVKGTGSDAAYYNLGVFYETTGKTNEAIKAYQRAVSLGSESASIRLKSL
ncbi:glycosyltransferase [Paenibacillus pasadenensis]|uniref:tetratricopeptide repeat-containing glycosyltransferase family 2 protein n=1 Tax=Paenibacillus pasadenensis TaxID=217090 RepID=UPI00203AC75E|nr:glycosyltransferase [Paenibacillus pasadenensis]MCM3750197.1 glycosyltransferase [Paenibacillus pasadenensis]